MWGTPLTPRGYGVVRVSILRDPHLLHTHHRRKLGTGVSRVAPASKKRVSSTFAVCLHLILLQLTDTIVSVSWSST
ncbi:hypothetical protein SAMN04488061_1882 [Filomicrobium insigne]|uniref:Uncharacterized protein n=1 Tax=Filomicrobium insigne TaxID=418854 RepID=A0A1H0N443_9HYPH|nr:hypothetical protein SAMN04488061_1882 [Filomicrobium insigne]